MPRQRKESQVPAKIEPELARISSGFDVAPRNSGRANSSMDEFAQKLHHFSGGRAFASQVPVRVTLARGFDDLRTRSPRETVDEEPIGIDTGLRQTAHVLVV